MEDSGEINRNHSVFPDWHVGLQPDLREGAIRKIMDSLMEICSGKPNVDKQQIRMGAEYFEAKAYHQATSKDDYLRNIYLMLLSFKRHKEDNILVDPPKSNFSRGSHLSYDTASPCLQPQIGNQEQATSQSPSQQSVLPQELQNSTSPIEVQGAAGLPFNTESSSNSKNLFEQRQRQGRQLQSMDISHHQKQSLCQGYYPYQIQQQTLKQNDQQPSNLQSHVQQQTQQQYQEAQVQEWFCLQTIHPGKFNIQLDHRNPVQPTGISVHHQLPPIAPFQHKPTSTFQQPAVAPQPHPCNNKQPNMPKVQLIQMATLQQSNLPDLQHQTLSFQQQDISSDLLGPQDNIPILHHQQQQQQQLLGTLPGVSNIQEHQNLALLAQPETARQQEESQRPALVLLQSQGHQARHQLAQPPTKAQQPPQPQTHQERFQSTGSLPPFPDAVEQKRKHVQLLGGSSTSPTLLTAQDDTLDLIEEIHQKIKEMKEIYYKDLLENYRKIVIKLHKLDAFPSHQKKPDERKRLIESRDFVKQALYYLGTDKEKIQAQLMERLIVMERKIRAYLELPPDKNDKIPLGQKESRHPGGNVELARQYPPCGASMAQNIDHHANQARQMNWRGSSISADEVAASTLLPSGAQLGIPKASGLHSDPAQGGSLNSLHCQPIGFSHQVGIGSIQNSTCGIYNNNTNRQSQSCVNPFQASASAIPPITYPMQPQKQEEQRQLMLSQLVKQSLPYYRSHLTQQSNRQQQQLQPQMFSELGQQQAMNLRGCHVGPFHQITEGNALKTKQDSGNCQKQFSTVQHNDALQLQGVDSTHASSPQKLQASSLKISQPSVGNDWIKLLPALLDDRISSQPVDSLLIMKSPSIPSMSVLGPEQQQLSEILSPSNAGHNGQQQMTRVSVQPEIHAPGTAMSNSSMTVEYVGSDSDQVKETTDKSSKRKRSTELLINAVQSAAPEVLDSSIKDIASVFDLGILSSSAPGNRPKSAVGENLVGRTKSFMSAQDYEAEVWSSRKKIRRDTSSVPFLDVPLTCGQQLEFAAPSTSECQANLVTALVQNEIKEINKRLIDIAVSVSKEEVARIAAQAVEGMVVSFAFTAVSISPNLISKLASQRMTPIMSLRLLVPLDYPKSSPVPLDKLLDEQSKESGDLSSKTMSKFNKSLQLVSQPISLSKMAKLWDASIRELMLEYAHQYGGGSFSSRVASWQTCLHH
ncbi:mediator of RNA polymerase II transcription subunit 15a-like [Dioscorea cayenensis subsp. rotundata]|uniref:Mediator of RNA polymerase II transcription subunit 15a-like n=1 Tax=Dioscorea cayennensis subsp. rotundata TaxID=55577 RepID=A0AB40C3Q0_DIOCR|nr:mediator of RNA polymerase II transcription subunit 15a-like [Dioscorea cayenensis subsp. rotundata]